MRGVVNARDAMSTVFGFSAQSGNSIQRVQLCFAWSAWVVSEDTCARQVLEERLESLIRFRWGPMAEGRPRAPRYRIETMTGLSPPDYQAYVWVVFDDDLAPQAVGIRLIEDPFTNPRYDVVDCEHHGKLFHSMWRHNSRNGWHQLGGHQPGPSLIC